MKKIIAIIANICLALVVLLGLLVIFSMLPIKGNYKLYTVMSGSMAPGIPIGSVVVVKPTDEYRVGDVITFTNPGSKDKTTHRINSIVQQNGESVIKTKGDANDAPDTSNVKTDQIIGKHHFTIPWVGYVLNYIKTPIGLILIIIIPSVIIIYEELRKIKKEAGELIKRRREKKKDATPNK